MGKRTGKSPVYENGFHDDGYSIPDEERPMSDAEAWEAEQRKKHYKPKDNTVRQRSLPVDDIQYEPFSKRDKAIMEKHGVTDYNSLSQAAVDEGLSDEAMNALYDEDMMQRDLVDDEFE